MRNYKALEEYSVFEINQIMDTLREQYDIVRLVDVEECRILDVQPDGELSYGKSCFSIWGRNNRCANCSSLRACMTHCSTNKIEHLGSDRESIHSIPVYLELINGETELCVIECVKFAGKEDKNYKVEVPAEYINTHDILTRLYTHEKMFREIRQHLNENPDMIHFLVLINIRNFQVVNKLFGVEGGNRLLTGIADILRRNYGDEEVYGRLRDDRFVLFIRKDKFDEKSLIEQMQEISSLIDSPIFTVQVKIGVYEIETRQLPVSAMIEHAEAAVDDIRDHRNVYSAHYIHSMMAEKNKNRHIMADFERALNNGEFHIFLQPQVRSDGTITGGEALVRWIQADGTILMPGEFLDVLSRSELLSHLDKHIWEKAIKLLADWKGSVFENLYLSVNVDPTDFYYIDVPKVLGKLCKKYDVSPEKLHVEITETALINAVENQNRIVEKLQNEGFIAAIDDFGKGYSSLSMLKDINANVLKIDMGFLQGDQNNSRSEVILQSIISMAKQLNMDIITEGVETKEQANRLIQLGCNHFQGFYYSRPIPVSDFEMIVRENLKN